MLEQGSRAEIHQMSEQVSNVTCWSMGHVLKLHVGASQLSHMLDQVSDITCWSMGHGLKYMECWRRFAMSHAKWCASPIPELDLIWTVMQTWIWLGLENCPHVLEFKVGDVTLTGWGRLVMLPHVGASRLRFDKHVAWSRPWAIMYLPT